MKSLLFLVLAASFLWAQDSSMVNFPASWNGAIASKPVAYSPNKAYYGFTHNTRAKMTQINVAQEIMQYAKRDTSQRMPPFMSQAYYIPDSLLTAKEQIWLCSLDVHMKYKMRQNTTIDSLCKWVFYAGSKYIVSFTTEQSQYVFATAADLRSWE